MSGEGKHIARTTNLFRFIGTLVFILGVSAPFFGVHGEPTVIYGKQIPYYAIVMIMGFVVTLFPTLWEVVDKSKSSAIGAIKRKLGA